MSSRISPATLEQIRQQEITGTAMGQYWKPVNLTKREFINPHKLKTGLKMVEQAFSSDIAAAMVILLSVMPQRRGGGDMQSNPFIGRWAGDMVVFVGDYSIDEDMPNSPVPFGTAYALTHGDDYTDVTGVMHKAFTDVTDDVIEIMQANGMWNEEADKQAEF